MSSLTQERHLETELIGALSPGRIGYGVVKVAPSFEAERSMHYILNPSGMTDWLSSWGYLGIFICVFVGNRDTSSREVILLAAGFLPGRTLSNWALCTLSQS
jgi:hypothetical protein